MNTFESLLDHDGKLAPNAYDCAINSQKIKKLFKKTKPKLEIKLLLSPSFDLFEMSFSIFP